MSISNELISLREASKITGYHPDYLSSLIRKNELKGHRLGRMWFVSQSELKDFIRQKENHTRSAPSNFFQKLTKVIFAIFVIVLVVFVSSQVIRNAESNASVASADNIFHQTK
jgi:excisionase family DNA binding protein